MKKCVGNLVFVFDLDKTLGYFTQVAIFIEGVEHYLGRKLKKNEVYKIFDLFPEMFRPDTMNILKYLKQFIVFLHKVMLSIPYRKVSCCQKCGD